DQLTLASAPFVVLLERRLGIQLIRRTQRGVYPEAGELLVGYVHAVHDRLRRAEAGLARLPGLERGTIRLGFLYCHGVPVHRGGHHPRRTAARPGHRRLTWSAAAKRWQAGPRPAGRERRAKGSRPGRTPDAVTR